MPCMGCWLLAFVLDFAKSFTFFVISAPSAVADALGGSRRLQAAGANSTYVEFDRQNGASIPGALPVVLATAFCIKVREKLYFFVKSAPSAVA